MKKVFAFGLDLEVEDWVKFLAVDFDGEIFGFREKPVCASGVWKVNAVDKSRSGLKAGFVCSMDMEIEESEIMVIGV